MIEIRSFTLDARPGWEETTLSLVLLTTALTPISLQYHPIMITGPGIRSYPCGTVMQLRPRLRPIRRNIEGRWNFPTAAQFQGLYCYHS
jgi:hypothetical protein